MGLAKPFEVIIETNVSCNYSCSFCFAKNFGQRPKQASDRDLRKVLDCIAAEGINRVRFTGGEPLLRAGLPELVEHAKELGLFTSLNTNASLVSNKIIKQLAGNLDDVLVSMHCPNAELEEKFSSKGSFEKKINAIQGLAGEGVFVRAATILSPENIAIFDELRQLVQSQQISQWVLLRPIPNPLNTSPISRIEIENAVEKVAELNAGRKKAEYTIIENALPFCCGSPSKVSQNALGGLREDGHSSLFIDSSLAIKPSYFLDVSLGNAIGDSIMEAWNSDFMGRMHSLEFIAEPCHKCRFVKKCMGGSRFSALLCNHSLYALDPLANPEKHASELF